MASFTREAEALEAWVAAEVACYRVANPRGAAVRETAALDSRLLGCIAGGSFVTVEARETLASGKARARVATCLGQVGWSTWNEKFFVPAAAADLSAAVAKARAAAGEVAAEEASIEAVRRVERACVALADGGESPDLVWDACDAALRSPEPKRARAALYPRLMALAAGADADRGRVAVGALFGFAAAQTGFEVRARGPSPETAAGLVIFHGWGGSGIDDYEAVLDMYSTLAPRWALAAACTPGFVKGRCSAAIDELRDQQLKTLVDAVARAPRVVFHTFSNQGCAGLEACLDGVVDRLGASTLKEKTDAFVFDSAADMAADAALFHQVITKSVAAELKAMDMPLHQVLDRAFERNVRAYCATAYDGDDPERAGSLDHLLATMRAADARALCLYSDGDKLITPRKVEQFAAVLETHHGPDRCARAKFAGPAHVRLFADDPDRYARELAGLFAGFAGEARVP